MPALNKIPGIGKNSRQLLEAAGVGGAEELAVQDPDLLVAELKRANKTLSLAKCAPGKTTVMKWIAAAMVVVEVEPEEDGDSARDPAPKADAPTRRRCGNVESTSNPSGRHHFDASAAKPIGAFANGGKRVPVSKSGHEEDRVSLIRAPREETNRGKDPESRRYIRGVLHSHPWSLRIGAVFALLLLVHLPLAIVSGFLLFASREYPETFYWVPQWLLAFPIALPLTGLGYLFWGMTGKCRICTQKLFVQKAALKHVKAHRFPGLGYVVPLCLHLLAFSWFRCSSCGTPVRLKK